MIIDIHTHIFPPVMRNAREDFFDDEPAFKLLYGAPNAKLAGATDLLHQMDEDQVDLSVIFGFPWKKASNFKCHNDYILEVAAKYPSRFKGLACFDAYHNEALLEAERCLDGGLAGIGELAFYDSDIDKTVIEKLAPIMTLCREKDVPLLLHTNEPVGHQYPGKAPMTLAGLYGFIRRFSENRIILAHWGGGLFFYALMKKQVQDVLKNVYFDTAASPFLYQPEVYQTACALCGSQKILLGTDYPLLKPARYYKEFEASALEPGILSGIKGENAKRVLGLAK